MTIEQMFCIEEKKERKEYRILTEEDCMKREDAMYLEYLKTDRKKMKGWKVGKILEKYSPWIFILMAIGETVFFTIKSNNEKVTVLQTICFMILFFILMAASMVMKYYALKLQYRYYDEEKILNTLSPADSPVIYRLHFPLPSSEASVFTVAGILIDNGIRIPLPDEKITEKLEETEWNEYGIIRKDKTGFTVFCMEEI